MSSFSTSFETLGTKITITVWGNHDPRTVFENAKIFLAWFEQQYSRFIPGNLLNTINRKGEGVLDEDMKCMVRFALDLAERTNGAFDPTIIPLLESIGYANKDAHGSRNFGYRHVQLKGHYITLENNVRIELGGVGKGYALEKIHSFFDVWERVMIDFGGDIYVRWGANISLEHPNDPKLSIGTAHLETGYFCASSGLRRRIGNQHHLIDPMTKKSATEVIASFVESPSGIIADGYATALCVCPLKQSLTLLGSGYIQGAIIAADGNIYRSEKSGIEFFKI